MKKEVLIVGKIPPPIGGVTIHVNRLLESLKDQSFNVKFYNLKSFSLLKFIKEMKRADVVHNHSNNRFFLFFFAVLGIFMKAKTVLTIHGNVKKLGSLKNYFERLAIKLVDYPILLNMESYNYSIKYNKKSELISSFIPPVADEYLLPISIKQEIIKLKQRYSVVFATNATSYALDLNGDEIYGVTNILEIFRRNKANALIISDPSGDYSTFLKNVPENILIIPVPHSFLAVIKNVDVILRATTTDGDSISIKEGLFLEKCVIASDCVSRPQGVVLFKSQNWESLSEIILGLEPSDYNKNMDLRFDELHKLFGIYESKD